VGTGRETLERWGGTKIEVDAKFLLDLLGLLVVKSALSILQCCFFPAYLLA